MFLATWKDIPNENEAQFHIKDCPLSAGEFLWFSSFKTGPELILVLSWFGLCLVSAGCRNLSAGIIHLCSAKSNTFQRQHQYPDPLALISSGVTAGPAKQRWLDLIKSQWSRSLLCNAPMEPCPTRVLIECSSAAPSCREVVGKHVPAILVHPCCPLRFSFLATH